jgi:hypothetical protein
MWNGYEGTETIFGKIGPFTYKDAQQLVGWPNKFAYSPIIQEEALEPLSLEDELLLTGMIRSLNKHKSINDPEYIQKTEMAKQGKCFTLPDLQSKGQLNGKNIERLLPSIREYHKQREATEMVLENGPLRLIPGVAREIAKPSEEQIKLIEKQVSVPPSSTYSR